MNERTEKVLIVDDDNGTLLGLSRVLESQGYIAKTASNGAQAISMAEKEHFDVFLLDILLPDIDGTELLTQIQSINPRAVKIMITGYPSVENAKEAINNGANAYFVKPLNAEVLLQEIRDKIKARNEHKLNNAKKEDWVKLRINKIQLNEYSQFAEETAELFTIFGLSRTQAKIYMALNALGVATASEIATLSKIRREEVYRIMPELENKGIVTSRLEAPRKFAATDPKVALNILIKMKSEELQNEMITLQHRKEELISRILSSSFGIYEENSVEALSRQDNVDMRISQMTKKAKNNILFVGSVDEMKKIVNETTDAAANQIKMRTVVAACELKDETSDSEELHAFRHFMMSAYQANCKVDLRQVAKRAFNLAIVDGKEAIWGEAKPEKTESKVFWTNDPVQVGILKRAFENLWQESLPCEGQDEFRNRTLV